MVEQLVLFKSLHAEIVLSEKKKEKEKEETNDVSGSRRGKCAAAVSLPATSFRRASLNHPDTRLQSSSATGASQPLTGNPIVSECDSEERAAKRGDAPQKGRQTAQRDSVMNWSAIE